MTSTTRSGGSKPSKIVKQYGSSVHDGLTNPLKPKVKEVNAGAWKPTTRKAKGAPRGW